MHEWKIHEITMKSHFYPFSSTVYLPNNDFLVMGGLNDSIVDKPCFTDQVLKISEIIITPLENLYTVSEYPHMIRSRGCFASIYAFDYVYVFGGVNYDNEKEMRFCERINITNPIKWESIRKMNLSRKNTSACSANKDYIYVFGGGNEKSNASDTIEQYNIVKNVWHLLNIRLPAHISFSISQRVSSEKILIIGGSEIVNGVENKQTANVFMFNYSGHKSTR